LLCLTLAAATAVGAAGRDFNGDGKSDILWRHVTDDEI
jgi:hypothetical protein